MVSVGVSTKLCYTRWEVETDEVVLQQRQKQIDYGKRTPGYQCFLQKVPKQGMESLLEPMDSTPLDDLLDDWLQALEPSEDLDGDQKGDQFVDFLTPASSVPWLSEEDPHRQLYFKLITAIYLSQI